MSEFKYQVLLDVDRDGGFDNGLSAIGDCVKGRMTWSNGMSKGDDDFASPARLKFVLDNRDGRFFQDDPAADYYGKLTPGMLVRVTVLDVPAPDDVMQLYEGRITEIRIFPGEFAEQDVSVTCEDFMPLLLDYEFVPELLTDVRTDEAIEGLFNSSGVPVAYPYHGSFFVLDGSRLDTGTLWGDGNSLISLDEGATSLEWVGDVQGKKPKETNAQAYLRRVIRAEAGGRFWWDTRSSTFKFHERLRDAKNGIVSQYLTMAEVTKTEPRYGDDLFNHITVRYAPRKVGGAGTIIYESDEAVTISAERERRINLKYTDPTSPDAAKIGAIDVISPVPGVDIIANTEEDGSGDAVEFPYSIEIGGSSAKLTVNNTRSDPIYLTQIRLKGTPLTSYKQETIIVADAVSIATYGLYPMPAISLDLVSDSVFAASYAQHMSLLYRTPRTRYESVTVSSVTVHDAVVTRTVGDRINLVDDFSGHDRDYIIAGEQHSVDPARGDHEVTWALKSFERTSAGILDTSRLDIDTYLTF